MNNIEETAFADIDFFFIFLVLFSKKITFQLKRTTLQKKIVIVKEEPDGTGNLVEDLIRLVFVHEECGNLKVFVNGGELTRNINEKKKPDV